MLRSRWSQKSLEGKLQSGIQTGSIILEMDLALAGIIGECWERKLWDWEALLSFLQDCTSNVIAEEWTDSSGRCNSWQKILLYRVAFYQTLQPLLRNKKWIIHTNTGFAIYYVVLKKVSIQKGPTTWADVVTTTDVAGLFFGNHRATRPRCTIEGKLGTEPIETHRVCQPRIGLPA